MKKLLLVLLFINIVNAQITRKELLKTAVTLDWKIEKSTANSITFLQDAKAYELNIAPLSIRKFTFNGPYQSSKLISSVLVSYTKVKYVAEVNFKNAPRVKETRIINSYKGEDYCLCFGFFKNARVRVTKYPTWVENKTAYYKREYEVY